MVRMKSSAPTSSFSMFVVPAVVDAELAPTVDGGMGNGDLYSSGRWHRLPPDGAGARSTRRGLPTDGSGARRDRAVVHADMVSQLHGQSVYSSGSPRRPAGSSMAQRMVRGETRSASPPTSGNGSR